MPWLTILGSGSWMPRPKLRFAAGTHEVSEEIAELARESGLRSLVVTAIKPVLADNSGGPLSREDFELGYGVRLVPEAVEEVEEHPEIPVDVTAFPCPACDVAPFPSDGALERHWEVHHALASG